MNPLQELLKALKYYFKIIQGAISAGWKEAYFDTYPLTVYYKGYRFHLGSSGIEKIAQDFDVFWEMAMGAENYLREKLKESKTKKEILAPYILGEKIQNKRK
ncbi:MAG: hypothetical protein DRN29_07060 [Thermoplasmata archaeon]|nr:MAG: hypothetical protein DRN29_07060 [Thermoplasmata archaeon]